jgi:hypothetical protein
MGMTDRDDQQGDGNPSRMQEDLNDVTGAHSEGNPGGHAPAASTPSEAAEEPVAANAAVSPSVAPGPSPDAEARDA